MKTYKNLVCLLFIFMFTGEHVAFALSNGDQWSLFQEMQNISGKRRALIKEQRQKIVADQIAQQNEAAVELAKVERDIKFTDYWIERSKIERKDVVRLNSLQTKLDSLLAKRSEMQKEIKQRTRDHAEQLQNIDQQSMQLETDIQYSETRFRSAMLSDMTNDKDLALGAALAAYGNPNWTPRDRYRCSKTLGGSVTCALYKPY